MGRKAIAVLLVALAPLVAGCGGVLSAIMPVVAEIIAVAAEASTKLDQIEAAGHAALAANPNPELAKKFDQAVAKARTSIAAVQRSAQGTENLNREDLNAAFHDFKVAYAELNSLFGPLGIAPDNGTLRATPGAEPLVMEPPAALTYQLPPAE